jgi:hypothetical protein
VRNSGKRGRNLIKYLPENDMKREKSWEKRCLEKRAIRVSYLR